MDVVFRTRPAQLGSGSPMGIPSTVLGSWARTLILCTGAARALAKVKTSKAPWESTAPMENAPSKFVETKESRKQTNTNHLADSQLSLRTRRGELGKG